MSAAPDPGPVIVIGGGIAGGAACLALAKRSVSATWIVPETALREKPGENLAAAATPLLEELGVAHLTHLPAHRRSLLSFSAWGSDSLLEQHAAAQPGGIGHIIDRARFEADLAGEAAAAPGIHRINDRIEAVFRDAALWKLRSAGGAWFNAGLIIDATGRKSVVGRAQSRQQRADRLTAAYAFIEQSDQTIDPTPATLIEAVPEGWWYACLLADRRLVLNFYTDPDLLPRGIAQQQRLWSGMVEATRYVSRWIESAGYTVETPPHLASAGTVWLESSAGSGWIAVGDAAVSFDPLSAHGMTTALWTGIQAAETASRTLMGDTDAIDRYALKMRDGVARYIGERSNIYARERRFTQHDFWRRRHGAYRS